MQAPILATILLIYGVNANYNEDCLNLQVSISQKVENEGFHREINWLIESLDLNHDEWSRSYCEIALRLNIPSEMFVNPDEIGELNRTGQISAYIEGYVNVETPAHESNEHQLYVFLRGHDIRKMSVRVPIHLRYQRAVIAGGSVSQIASEIIRPFNQFRRQPTMVFICLSDRPVFNNRRRNFAKNLRSTGHIFKKL
ncbi:hypothetical protein PPYR_12700 [Photinus pyralis]|uniref:Phosphatidylinositol-glycan biosynthesis class X protein n=1 Tax=Photinus pyralis TaxID=7054 RepID=A0A5N4A6X6_PHOPY|nr:uncharacterized protein LOC116177871 isoform X3 [Photinus pyralis]KAB0793080.1 hypothetical protein PPYR_12700 [Photinus pyralis]